MGRMGWAGDMLDCLANIENAELKRKIVWPIAPRKPKNVATARVSISRVCNGRRWSAFGCDWKIAGS